MQTPGRGGCKREADAKNKESLPRSLELLHSYAIDELRPTAAFWEKQIVNSQRSCLLLCVDRLGAVTVEYTAQSRRVYIYFYTYYFYKLILRVYIYGVLTPNPACACPSLTPACLFFSGALSLCCCCCCFVCGFRDCSYACGRAKRSVLLSGGLLAPKQVRDLPSRDLQGPRDGRQPELRFRGV